MSNLQLLTLIENFPIGDMPNTREEMLSKAEIISFLSRFQEQFSCIENVDEREFMVKNFLSEVLVLGENETIPSLAQAERILKLSNGFIQDYGKIEYIREHNPDFDRTYKMIANSLGLENESAMKLR